MVESGTSYNPRITRINVNGKTAYELKGGFFDDLHKIAFSGTNREDAVEYIKNFLKIVDPIDLLNVSYERLWLVVFPFSLVGSASEWMNKFKGSITSWVDLTDKFLGEYYPPCRTGRIATPMSKWDPTNLEFKNCLASKFVNYKRMDTFIKEALWDYSKMGSDEAELTE
ncbi:hypothetical protein Tco_0151528 [Tanacetum coccineum]